MAENLSLERDADGVALLTLRVAEFTAGLAADLQAAVDEIARRDEVRGVVITGGAAGFLAGARIEPLLAQVPAGALTAARVAAWVAPVRQTLRRLESLGKPVAAAINGDAQGGGFELCLACHHRVLADDAAVGLTETQHGLIPGGGGTQRLPRVVGIERALPLMLQGRLVPAAEALRLGLVHATLPRDAVVEAARRWVLAHPTAQQPWDVKGFRIPGGAGALAPHAAASFGLGVARARRDAADAALPLALLSAVYEGTQLPIDKALALEAKYFGLVVAGPHKETTT